MNMRWFLGGILVLVWGLPGHAEAPLKRLTLRQDVLGWEAVGRIELDARGYCTGVLIAPDIVLTAAHCLIDRQGSYQTPETIRFRAGLRDGAALAETGVRRIVVHPRYDPGAADVAERIRYDAGLMQLADPIPVTTAAPFQTSSLSDGARDLSVVSFGRGRDEALSRDENCSVVGRERGLIAFDCDVTFGSSGAPVFHRTGNRASVVSLVSTGFSGGGQRFAVGMELPQVVADLKVALRRGGGIAWDRAKSGIVTRGKGPESGGAKASGGAKFLRP